MPTNADDYTSVFDINNIELPNIPESDPGVIVEPTTQIQQPIIAPNNTETVISEIVGEPIIDQNKGQQ